MHVAGILNDKGHGVVTMGPRSTVKEAIALMAQKRIGAVVVAGVERRALGIFSERDVVRVLAEKGPEGLTDELSRHMTSPVLTCTPQTSIDEIMHLMTSKKFRHVPVVENDALTGLVSIGDVVKFRLAEIETEHKAMRDYIASA
ncbi:CBS domain-containing protein [Rhizobiales bacterium GAS191]|nr:CBS domain-containing protein [Rhizobiales bacterium GAS191]